MKFLNNILTFTLAITTISSVHSYSIKNEFKKRGLNGCADIYDECGLGTKVEKNNVDGFCSTFTSEKCLKLYTEGINSIPECKDVSNDLLSDVEKDVTRALGTIGIYCLKDENNHYCPMSEVEINKETVKNKEKYMNIMKETCKSKKCTEEALTYFNNKLKVKDYVVITNMFSLKDEMDGNVINELSNYLKSEECTSQYGNYINGYNMTNISTNDNGDDNKNSFVYHIGYTTSDATILKKSFSLVLVIYLLLNILY